MINSTLAVIVELPAPDSMLKIMSPSPELHAVVTDILLLSNYLKSYSGCSPLH
jgi:hypothetical protein